MTLVLDDGEVLLKPGSVVIQRGTNQAWANRSGRMCRMLFVLVAGTYDSEIAETCRPIGLPHRQYRHKYCSLRGDMKFATYHDGTRDGQLWVFSRDLYRAIPATGTLHPCSKRSKTWDEISPKLAALYDRLNNFEEPFATRFEPERCLAPLPRPRNGWMLRLFSTMVG